MDRRHLTSTLLLAGALAGCGGPSTATEATGSSTDKAKLSASGTRPGATGTDFCTDSKMAVVKGTESDDLLLGGTRPQAFEALGGNDTVKAGAEGSCLSLSAGDDSGIGGEGNDQIAGGDGDDLIQPGGGDDSVIASLGKDYVVASAGNDRLSGGVGKDIVIGGPGDDSVFGAADSDLLGGGPGNDRMDSADGYRDLVDCGTGNDRVLADRLDVLTACEATKTIKKKARAKDHAKKHEAARAALEKSAASGR